MSDFRTLQAELEYFRALEVQHRKSGAAHPDRCPKLTLRGVEFAIPARGAKVAPQFKDGKVMVAIADQERWPQAEGLLASMPVVERNVCPQCGQARTTTLEIEVNSGTEFLVKAFELAAAMLRVQYDLTDEQLADLLAFDAADKPQWIGQLIRWCNGLPTAMPEPMPFEEYPFPDPLAQTETPAPATHWWKRWGRN